MYFLWTETMSQDEHIFQCLQ